MRTRIKFCGMTRVDDALAAAQLGADAIGLIFAHGSPRRIDADDADRIARAMPPFVCRVGLFLDQHADAVARTVNAVALDLLQFHGREEAAFCRMFGKPYIKVVPMLDVDDVAAFAAGYPDAAGFLLDSLRAGAAGGTGQTFDWTRAVAALDRPILLAGGLNPQNVHAAVTSVKPWAVDASSGIETSPGIKDHARMRVFIDEVHRGSG